MAKYIDRDPVFKDICVEEERAHQFRCPMGADVASFRAGMLTAFGLARCIIDRKKPADVAPVRHGRWVKYAGKLVCSECKKYPPMKDESGGWRTYHEWTYCPNCGAKMDGEANDE